MITRAGRRTVLGGAAQVALVPAAAFAVHQLRFMLAFGSSSGAALAQTGHNYLHSVVPWLMILAGVAAGAFLWGLGRALAGQRSAPRYALSLGGLWLTCVIALVVIYAAQELLEGWFATGHAAGLQGVFGYGGWWSIPAAAAVGLVLAVIFHGARWALDEAARRFGSVVPTRRRLLPALPRPVGMTPPRLVPLADGSSGRGPPR